MLAYIDPTPIVTVTGTLGLVLAALAAGTGFALALLHRFRAFYVRHLKVTLPASVAVVLVVAALAYRVAGSEQQAEEGIAVVANAEGRLIILGLDGLSADLMDRMLAEGKLPNFDRLRQQGGYRCLATTNPPQSPVAWATFATGRNPGEHGICDFIRRAPDSYTPELGLTETRESRLSTALRAPAFWDYAGNLGVPVTIVGCPVTYPPSPVNGRMLSGMGTPDLLGTQGTFAFYTTEMETISKDTGGEVIVVEESNGHITAKVEGPQRASLSGKTERLSVPLEIQIAPDRTVADIQVGGAAFSLCPGEWSDWTDISFRIGPIRRMKGMTRFHLTELKPHLKLYMSPISMAPSSPWTPVSHPKTYSRELAEATGPFSTRGMPYDTWGLNEGRISEDAFLQHAEDTFQDRKRHLDYELARTDRGVLFVYFEYPDIIQHLYWGFLDPKHPRHDPSAPPELKAQVETCYRKMDDIVGGVMDKLGPGDTLLCLSDHGFTSFRRTLHLNSWLRDRGLLVLKDPSLREGRELFGDVDWPHTRAYALGFGGVYLNTKGREPEGVVNPGAESEALLNALSKALSQLRDPADDALIVNMVYRGTEIFRGPNAERAPDLYLGLQGGYRVSWETALGAAPDEWIGDNDKLWSGTHLVDPVLVPGILFSSRPLTSSDPTLYDVAPTALHWMGMSDDQLLQEGFQGRTLF